MAFFSFVQWAKNNGLTPSFRHKLIFAPLLSKSLTTLSCPFWQAKESGLAPFLSHELFVSSMFSKSCTMLLCPFLHASWRQLVPSFWHKFKSASLRSKSYTMLSFSFWQAKKRGLILFFSAQVNISSFAHSCKVRSSLFWQATRKGLDPSLKQKLLSAPLQTKMSNVLSCRLYREEWIC